MILGKLTYSKFWENNYKFVSNATTIARLRTERPQLLELSDVEMVQNVLLGGIHNTPDSQRHQPQFHTTTCAWHTEVVIVLRQGYVPAKVTQIKHKFPI
jgi:hypothetical protein